MKVWDVAAPMGEQHHALRMVGKAMLMPGSSEAWREVFAWCGRNRDHEIVKTILRAYAAQGGDVDEALALGDDLAEMRKEPRWLTRALATADGGDVEAGVRERLETRKLRAMERAARKQREVLG